MANTGLSLRWPPSLLVVIAIISVAMCFPITSAMEDGYTNTAIGMNPRLRSRFLASVTKRGDTCSARDTNACAGGPAGQYLKCCGQTCTDLLTSRSNCGACGVRCAYSQLCCNGQCTTVAYDTKNCGTCGSVCQTGRRCTYGMCGYA